MGGFIEAAWIGEAHSSNGIFDSMVMVDYGAPLHRHNG
jgi:hypothetical protein